MYGIPFQLFANVFFFFLTITTAVAMHSVIKENNLHIKKVHAEHLSSLGSDCGVRFILSCFSKISY